MVSAEKHAERKMALLSRCVLLFLLRKAKTFYSTNKAQIAHGDNICFFQKNSYAYSGPK